MNWNTFFNTMMILVSLILMATVLLQNRSSGAGSIFGQQTTVFRTRRGLEKILYRATIAFGVVFIITAMASVRAHTPTAPAPDLTIPGASVPVSPAPSLPVIPAPAPGDAAPPAAVPPAPAPDTAQPPVAAPSGAPDAPAPVAPPAPAP